MPNGFGCSERALLEALHAVGGCLLVGFPGALRLRFVPLLWLVDRFALVSPFLASPRGSPAGLLRSLVFPCLLASLTRRRCTGL